MTEKVGTDLIIETAVFVWEPPVPVYWDDAVIANKLGVGEDPSLPTYS